jgi:glycosyltransferase involved in cell wall biosynthesis
MKKIAYQPKVSIITTVFNAAGTIERTVMSVLRQSYTNIEYIIVDGGSTDGTVELIEQYKDRGVCIISGPDDGIGDGFNKGIRMATGEWIGLINADDWYTLGAVEAVMSSISDKDEVCCGNIGLTGNNGYYRVKKSKVAWLNFGMYIMHPSCFIRKDVYNRIGLYDTKLKIAMDFDLFLRIRRAGIRITYIDELIACMGPGGASSDIKKMHREELRVMRRHLALPELTASAVFNYLNRLRWRFFYRDPFVSKPN